jgi:glutathione S-transferase
MAVAHKGLDVEMRDRSFTQKDEVIAAGGKSYPCMIEADGTVSDDSKIITDRVEEVIPKPSLFPGGMASRTTYDFIHCYVQTVLAPNVGKMIIADIPDLFDDPDKAYFIESREARFGKTLAEVSVNRDKIRETVTGHLEPFRKAMTKTGWVSGDDPAMADYVLFGVLQWARVSSTYAIISADDVIAGWMEKMLDLHDGLGRKTAAAS